MLFLLLAEAFLLSKSLLNDGKLIANLLLDRFFDTFSIRDALFQRLVKLWDLVLQAVTKIVDSLIILGGFFSNCTMNLPRSFANKLPKLIIGVLLSLELISQPVRHSRLELLHLLKFSIHHVLVLSFLCLNLFHNLFEQLSNRLKLGL